MLEIADLTHSYADGHTAIDGLTLSVEDGSLVSIVGPSGCGKSTLLRCIAGLISPSGGTVTLNGRPIDGVPDDLAVVFQDYSRSLFPWMTVRDNVALPLKRKGLSRSARREAADKALAEVGLEGAGRKYHWQLSGGMQQRVAIARALAYKPSLLLMDEPFGAVDAQTREDLEDLVLKLHRSEKMTILLVTHDIDESVYVGDRVVVLGKSPTSVRADLPVDLPTERDQIETRADPEFIRMRAEVGRLIRGTAVAEDETGTAPETAAEPDEAETAAPAESVETAETAETAETETAKKDEDAKSEDAKSETETSETKAETETETETAEQAPPAKPARKRRSRKAKAAEKAAEAEATKDEPAKDEPAADAPVEDKPAEDKASGDKPEEKATDDGAVEEQPSEPEATKDETAKDETAKDETAKDETAEKKAAEQPKRAKNGRRRGRKNAGTVVEAASLRQGTE
ncbi:ATP-binding cassette domain-containing protein [Actinomadura logoneensis]|uniref:ATP-binding cassette domain-containing protein n=1 Tax=Actinomadura logoneensis TaxID=2293572 RepID=A0A372JLF7_9ACTN|nr:ATP-binding cassette domain-containing protein [Actinomadura logoneensis]